jgi:hypothetical protein
MRSINLQMDGNQVCATWDNFDCLATSPAGFGDTIWQAFGRLIDNTPAIEINAIVTSIENAPQNTKELPATVPAGAAANTASPKYPQIEEIFKELSFLAYGPLNGRETNLVLSTFNFIERKLWA